MSDSPLVHSNGKDRAAACGCTNKEANALEPGDDTQENRRRAAPAEAEAELARTLTEGAMEAPDPAAGAVRRLPPRWEIRIQTERDPVAVETEVYRSLAEEADDRYDRLPARRKPKEEDRSR